MGRHGPLGMDIKTCFYIANEGVVLQACAFTYRLLKAKPSLLIQTQAPETYLCIVFKTLVVFQIVDSPHRIILRK